MDDDDDRDPDAERLHFLGDAGFDIVRRNYLWRCRKCKGYFEAWDLAVALMVGTLLYEPINTFQLERRIRWETDPEERARLQKMLDDEEARLDRKHRESLEVRQEADRLISEAPCSCGESTRWK